VFAFAGTAGAGEFYVDNPEWQSPGNDIQVEWGASTYICSDFFCTINDPGLIDGVTPVTLTAIPTAGWIFDYWDDGTSTEFANPYTYTHKDWLTVAGHFKLVPTWNLTVNVTEPSYNYVTIDWGAGVNTCSAASCNYNIPDGHPNQRLSR
jgi:hypothetical protein